MSSHHRPAADEDVTRAEPGDEPAPHPPGASSADDPASGPDPGGPDARATLPTRLATVLSTGLSSGAGSRLWVRVTVAYLALRLVSGVMVALAARDQVPVPGWTGPHVSYLDMTVLWDGSWYRKVAEEGYPATVPLDPASGHPAQNAWAFYPLFPLLARLGMAVTGLGFPLVASTLAVLCGLGAALLMSRVLAGRVGERVALAAVVVWAAFPSAVSLQLAYTESLAMLVLCAALWATLRHRWLLAGGLTLVMGVTRPIAVPLALVVAVALVLRWRSRREQHLSARQLLSGLAGLAMAGAGGLVWPVVAWARTGDRTAYTDTMAAWRTGGQLVPLKPWLWMSEWVFRDAESHAATLGPVALAAVATTLVVLAVGPWAARLGPVLRAWCLAYPAYLALVLDPFTSIFRYLLPLFPLLVVILGGGWADRRLPRGLGVRATVLVLLGVLGQAVWIWQLLVYVPPSDYPP